MSLPNGHFNFEDISGANQPVATPRDLRAPLFATIGDKGESKVAGPSFTVGKSDSTVAINTDPQVGIRDVAKLLDERLEELSSVVGGSQEAVKKLLGDINSEYLSLDNLQLLRTIEAFVENSKYALVTYESLQSKIDTQLSPEVVANRPKLQLLKERLDRTLNESLKQRNTIHESFADAISALAQHDDQLIALGNRCYFDLGVSSDDGFNELWSQSVDKHFVALPKNYIEFLKRFETILQTAIETSKNAGLFEKAELSAKRNPPQVPDETCEEDVHRSSSRFLQGLNKITSKLSHAFLTGIDSIRAKLAASTLSARKIGAVTIAFATGIVGIGFGVNSLVGGSEQPDQEKSEQGRNQSDAKAQGKDKPSELLNPNTNKPFTEKEIKFITWVAEQIEDGKTVAQIEQMMANLIENQNRFYGWVSEQSANGKTEDEIKQMFDNLIAHEQQKAINEITPISFETEEVDVPEVSFIKSARVGGDASRKAKIKARSEAARRNKEGSALIGANLPQSYGDSTSQIAPAKVVSEPRGLEPLSL